MTAIGTKSNEISAPQKATSSDGTRVSVPLDRPPMSQQVLVWAFGILELLIELASESVNRTRERVRVIQQVNGGHAGNGRRPCSLR
jgi:hypothetical protein